MKKLVAKGSVTTSLHAHQGFPLTSSVDAFEASSDFSATINAYTTLSGVSATDWMAHTDTDFESSLPELLGLLGQIVLCSVPQAASSSQASPGVVSTKCHLTALVVSLTQRAA
eukprot:2222588-Amphidinium_carterae.1